MLIKMEKIINHTNTEFSEHINRFNSFKEKLFNYYTNPLNEKGEYNSENEFIQIHEFSLNNMYSINLSCDKKIFISHSPMFNHVLEKYLVVANSYDSIINDSKEVIKKVHSSFISDDYVKSKLAPKEYEFLRNQNYFEKFLKNNCYLYMDDLQKRIKIEIFRQHDLKENSTGYEFTGGLFHFLYKHFYNMEKDKQIIFNSICSIIAEVFFLNNGVIKLNKKNEEIYSFAGKVEYLQSAQNFKERSFKLVLYKEEVEDVFKITTFRID